MHVGEFDPGWEGAMRVQAARLREQGFRVHFEVEAGMAHGLDSLAGKGSKRLFEHFEDSVENCQ